MTGPYLKTNSIHSHTCFHTCKARKRLLLEGSWQDRVSGLTLMTTSIMPDAGLQEANHGAPLVINHVTVATSGLGACQVSRARSLRNSFLRLGL